MNKIVGAFLIIAGSIFVALQQIQKRRNEFLLLQSLIGALRTMESAIRWKGLTLPECFHTLEMREKCGNYFRQIYILLQSNIPLQSAWNKIFRCVENDISNIMLQMDWDGDEAHLLGNLQYVLQGLSRLYEDRINKKRSENKLLIAATVSGAGLLVIILL